ncbi:response regulator [Candidatus Omnitrophota bacterium]
MKASKILILEGDTTLSMLLGTRLGDQGYIIKTHRTGRKALKELKRQWVDLLIVSINLQGEMDGFGFLKEIKKDKELSKIPILVSSSKPGMKGMFEELGIDGFFEKPFSVDVFQKKVEKVLTKKRQLNIDKI